MKYLDAKEQKQFLKIVHETKGKKAERDYMILFLGLNAGLRLNEMICLNVGDVRGMDKLLVRPETTKRTRSQADGTKKAVGRIVPLNEKLQQAIKKFISLKLKWGEGIQDEAPLFVSKKGARLSRRALQDMFEAWRDKAGLPGYYTVHSLRHSFARRFLERSPNPYLSLPALQKIMGHASLSSTGVYLEASMEEMQAGVEAL